MGRKLPGSDFFLFGLRINQAHGSFPDHRIVTEVDENVVEGVEDRVKRR